jgi:hypothetical protein
MKIVELIKEHSAKIQSSLSNLIKIILFLSLLYSAYFHLWHIFFSNFLLLILSFIPYIIKKHYEITIPKEFEFLFLIIVLITFLLGGIKGWIIQLFFGISLSFIGFGIMLILYSNSKLKKNYSLILLFSFSFSLALAVIAELMKYYIKGYLKLDIGLSDYIFAITNLTYVSIGAILSSIIGYLYMKGYRPKFAGRIVKSIKSKNPNLFIEKTDSPEELIILIKKGESEKLEFKSTLRTNLYTNEIDKKIETSTLKTIVGFLNTEGGTLLIGVSDKGEILGIEKDNFQSNDKFCLHFTNLIKGKIGNPFLPYIHSELVMLENKNILKVECEKSQRPVFLKNEEDEDFYIRAGPASVLISGTKLIGYINNNFKDIS